MEQRDYLLREIEKIGVIMSAFLKSVLVKKAKIQQSI